MKRYLFLVVVLSVSHFAKAQLELENNPPRLKWDQINTPNFKILFPRGFDVQAQRMANTLEHVHKVEANSLGSVPRKLPVILQNQSAVSNGFVSVLPRRSEFYAMPPQDYNFLGTTDWLTLLAVHEYRHVVQYQHAMQGFNRLLFYLFGYPTLAGMSQLAAPQWFWEGDAVAVETAFTPGGRGRIPNFGLLFKTNLMEGRTFNYHKQHLRSFKHNIPNHYVLGYHMVSYLRKKTGDPDIWGKISARSWSVPFIPFAFSNALKKESGLYVTGLYKEMASELKDTWQKEMENVSLTGFKTINRRKTKAYTDYLYPLPQNDGSVLALKKGIGDIEQFVLLQGEEEKTVFTPGFMNDAGMLSAAMGTVVWNEYGFDARWQVRNFSLIKAYDFNTKQKLVVSAKDSRYASASLSADAKKIVTVETDQNYRHSLVEIAFPGGQVLKKYPNPSNHFYAMPRYSDDGRIAVLKITDHGKTISIFSESQNQGEDVLPITQENVGHPVLVDKYLFFNSPVSGVDNIYVIDLESKQRFQVTSSRYGAYNPAVTNDRRAIYYNDQTRDGFDVVKIPFDPASWKPYVEKTEAKSFYQHLVEQEGRPNLVDSIPQKQHPVTRYSRMRGIINPFSWGAFVEDNYTRVDVGITSRDILSTTNITAGYTFDIQERTGFWRVGLSYQGWFPIIDVDFRQGKRAEDEGAGFTLTEISIARTGDTVDIKRMDQHIRFEWKEQNIEAGMRIPLNLTNSKYFTKLSVGNYVGYTKVTEFKNVINGSEQSSSRFVPGFIVHDTVTQDGNDVARTRVFNYLFFDYIGNADLIYNHFSISGYRLMKRSRRDIFSKWGQAIYLDIYNTAYGSELDARNFSLTGYMYLPGFFKHHSINGYLAYQETQVPETQSGYLFRNQVPAPRGLSVGRFEKFTSLAVNYTLPLWYPDAALGPVLNLQRIRANLFYDYAFGASRIFSGNNVEYASVGGEIKVDLNIMRFLPQIDVGFRFSYGLKPSVTNFEFLIGTFNF